MSDVELQTVSFPSRLAGGQELDQQRSLHERVVAGEEAALLEAFDRTAGLVFCAALLLSGSARRPRT